ncbi:TonB-dependent receptor [Halosquirtibacter xylanolyticus]|uniref:TonB-dependent receptor n=1 Tax=Halosquirtibacter xylanolyticus TaxID=3374599 RepID=UPI003749E2D9|nr:TonB-dependent receptor [Prolixibacteraceae bacterium]
MIRRIIIFVFIIQFGSTVLGQEKTLLIRGIVETISGNPIDGASIIVPNSKIATISHSDGSFELSVSSHIKEIIIRHISFQIYHLRVDDNMRMPLRIVMKSFQQEISQVEVESMRSKSSMNSIGIENVQMAQGASGGLERVLKTQPGVQSRNELSNQYTVRGGNYDENLMYINGIEIHKSLLYRSGKQEGLSSVNPQMVDQVQFSTGGFSSQYGDKLSSVLDVKYKKAKTFNTQVDASLLGAGLHTEGRVGRLSYNVGLRYKTTNYMLSGMDEKGDYSPVFYDVQSMVTYDLSKSLSLDYLFFLSKNEYAFQPTSRETKFGTINNPIHFMIYYEGEEKDHFLNYTNALKLNWKPNQHSELSLVGSRWDNKERIRYDIMGQYYLHKAGYDSSNPTQDTDNHAGVGTDMKHANEKVNITINTIQLDYKLFNDFHRFQIGAKIEKEDIYEDSKRWSVYDSSGYFLPNTNDLIQVTSHYKMQQSMVSNRYQAYVSDNLFFPIGGSEMGLNLGLRYQYWDYLDEQIWSPRASINLKFNNDKTFRFAWGVYQQMPFYKEFKGIDGTFFNDLKPQKSIHYILGYSQPLSFGNRQLKFSVEAYYKKLSNMIPYLVDNVYIQYLPQNISNGYSKGIDMKLAGEFVPGVDSWISLSFMKTEEDIEGDAYGSLPRPSDQRVNFNLFYQDYLPGNKNFKMKLLFYLSSGLPFTAPQATKTDQYFKMPMYKRVDVGFSRTLLGKGKSKWFKEAWIAFDIFNMFDMSNTISYYWITDINNNQYGVPNYLTGRLYNVSLMFSF